MHWFYDPNLGSNSSRLPDQEAAHAAKSLRVLPSEVISITNGEGLVIEAEVTNVKKSELDYRILTQRKYQRPQGQLALIQALAKGDRDEMALQSCVEVGLSIAMPWQSERSVVRWNQEKVEKGLGRWRQIAIEAMKQSQQPFLCEIPSMYEFGVSLPGKTLVLDPFSEVSLLDLGFPSGDRVNLIVGPEGGLSSAELQQFTDLGYQRVRLGSSIMRTSTAGLAAISVIRTLQGAWQEA